MRRSGWVRGVGTFLRVVGALSHEEQGGVIRGIRGGREEGSIENQAGRVRTAKTLEGGREGSDIYTMAQKNNFSSSNQVVPLPDTGIE